jgi:hypothetical protein
VTGLCKLAVRQLRLLLKHLQPPAACQGRQQSPLMPLLLPPLGLTALLPLLQLPPPLGLPPLRLPPLQLALAVPWRPADCCVLQHNQTICP